MQYIFRIQFRIKISFDSTIEILTKIFGTHYLDIGCYWRSHSGRIFGPMYDKIWEALPESPEQNIKRLPERPIKSGGAKFWIESTGLSFYRRARRSWSLRFPRSEFKLGWFWLGKSGRSPIDISSCNNKFILWTTIEIPPFLLQIFSILFSYCNVV